MIIRSEKENDWEAVYVINSSAFETSAEAELVNTLRESVAQIISLVAEHNKKIIGHILFSPITLSGHQGVKIMGLAPMAAIPEHQRQGVGSELVRAGIEECKKRRYDAIVVLGHPEYYPRFGFVSASEFGIDSEYDVPEGVFMVMELEEKVLNGISGTVKYHAAFNSV